MMLFGMAGIPALIAPYSSYGRIASELFAPVYAWLNNILAYFSGRLESYAFYSSDVWLKSGITLLVAAVSFAVIAVLAWRNGRTYCNTICPVGTVLGFLSRFSIFKIRISGDKCVGCKLCSRSCKASCIDIKNKKVDYSRCVACMDCIDNCVRGAISYSALRPVRETSLKQPDGGRRNFLSLSTLMIASAATASAKEKGGNVIAALERKKPYVRETPVVPPGAVGAKHFAEHCTACQLCVQSCTNDVLRPSGSIYHFMQPSMSYERGFCRPECTACSEVCPSGAILPVSREKKSSIQIGHAVWIRDNCIVITDGVHCGNCSRHCPSGAITMVKENPSDPHSARVPAVNEQRCIGCGACEYVCPARPFAAIHVEGHQMHKII
jgi:ferredoxin